jgi:hypothetical protein
MAVLGLVELKFTLELVHWHRSKLAQNVDTEDLADSFMAFNTNYRDFGIFGIYAIAKVNLNNTGIVVLMVFQINIKGVIVILIFKVGQKCVWNHVGAIHG